MTVLLGSPSPDLLTAMRRHASLLYVRHARGLIGPGADLFGADGGGRKATLLGKFAGFARDSLSLEFILPCVVVRDMGRGRPTNQFPLI